MLVILDILDTQSNIHLMFKIANDLRGDLNTGIFFPSADTIAFTEGGVEAMRINSDGNVALAKNIGLGGATPTTSGTGITFPASQSASTNANTLDDYEEGTWTPIDGSGAGLTLTVSGTPRYVKIGRFVFFTASNIDYPSTASASLAQIAGLPFTVDSNNNGTLSFVANTVNAAAGLTLAGGTGMFIYAHGTIDASTNANLSLKQIYGISGCYQV